MRQLVLSGLFLAGAFHGVAENAKTAELNFSEHIAPRLIYMDDQKLLEVELDKEICGALEDLSKPQAYDEATDEAENEIQKGDKQRDSSPEVTTET
jgi:hypothetical protein